MNAASSASEAPGLESATHGDAVASAPPPVERRHGVEYLKSGGFDFPLALFWGAYLAACLGVIIGWFWS